MRSYSTYVHTVHTFIPPNIADTSWASQLHCKTIAINKHWHIVDGVVDGGVNGGVDGGVNGGVDGGVDEI